MCVCVSFTYAGGGSPVLSTAHQAGVKYYAYVTSSC